MKKLLLIMSILLAFYFIPASWVVKAFFPTYTHFSYDEINRAWWNGHIKKTSIILRGYRVLMGDVHWRYEWLSIFSGMPCVTFYSYDVLIQSAGRLCYQLDDGRMIIRDLDFSLSAEEVAAVAGVEVIGRFEGYVEEAVVYDDQVVLVQGNTVWKDAQWHNGEKWLSLGQLLLTATTENDSMAIHSRDVDGPITVDLTMFFQKQYLQSVIGSIHLNDTVDTSLRDTINLFTHEVQGQKYLVEYYFNPR
jgi:hypothetical protein